MLAISRSQVIPIAKQSLVFIINLVLSIKKRRRNAGFSVFELCILNISFFTLLQYFKVSENKARLMIKRIPRGPEKNIRLANPIVSSTIFYLLISNIIICFLIHTRKPASSISKVWAVIFH